MAIKKDEAKSGELIPAPTQSMEVIPDFIEQTAAREGMEHLRKEDIQMPRIGLAQQMSPELVADDAKFIEGLRIGDMFNTLTGAIYGVGPLNFCVLRADPPRFIEFSPDGKSILDPNVQFDDPRTQFGPKGEKPIAMKFYDFIVMLLPSRELVALSFKSTGIRVAKQLNGLITFRGQRKLFAGQYQLGTTMTQNTKGRFAIFTIKNAGWLPDKPTYDYASALYEDLSGKEVVIDRDGRDNDPDSFNPADLEAQVPGGR